MKKTPQHQPSDPSAYDSSTSIQTNSPTTEPLMSPIAGDVNALLSDIARPELACAGRHIVMDFWGAQHLQDTDIIEQALKAAAAAAGAVLLHVHAHKFSGGGGVTGVALLAESHISIHTWPEYDYAAFDIFMCGDAKPEKSVEVLDAAFKPQKVAHSLLRRGQLAPNLGA